MTSPVPSPPSRIATLRERTRWCVARLMDHLPGQCWANLVSWALRTDGYRMWQPVDSMCRSDLARNGSCYCGKLRNPGGQP